MLTLKNDWLEVAVNEADGCLHSLRLSSLTTPVPYEYVEPTAVTDPMVDCLWGQWEVRDSFTTYRSNDAKLHVFADINQIISIWDMPTFTLSISRELHDKYLAETVTLEAKETMAVIDFSVAFRPAITNFLDAS